MIKKYTLKKLSHQQTFICRNLSLQDGFIQSTQTGKPFPEISKKENTSSENFSAINHYSIFCPEADILSRSKIKRFLLNSFEVINMVCPAINYEKKAWKSLLSVLNKKISYSWESYSLKFFLPLKIYNSLYKKINKDKKTYLQATLNGMETPGIFRWKKSTSRENLFISIPSRMKHLQLCQLKI